MFLETGIVFLVIVLLFIFWRKRPRRFPPGPFSWPLVGNLLQVGSEPFKTVMEMRKTYGDIIAIDLGLKRAVFINDLKLIKEAFNMPVFCGRPDFPHFANPDNGLFRGLGILFSGHKTSTEQRQFAFSKIQSGFRNGVSIEKLVLNEANELIGNLKELLGKPVSTSLLFNISVVNSLWMIVAGERYNIQDENYVKIVHHYDELASSQTIVASLVFFPFWGKLAPKLSGFEHVMANLKPLYEFAQKIIDGNKFTYQEGVERNFVDSYLEKMERTENRKSSFFKTIGMENLRHTLFDLFGAGTETVSTTLRWLIFLMAKYPQVQEKLSHLIVNQKQKNGNIMLKDRTKLPYVEAVILEVMRFSSITPLGLFHETVEDVEFHGYVIPKGTMVVANQFGIHHNPEVWGDPQNFRPERFLSDDGTKVIGRHMIIPFSAGRRVCPGEFLAKDELFIFIVKLIECFKIQFDKSEPLSKLKYIRGSVLSPPEHKVLFQNRSL